MAELDLATIEKLADRIYRSSPKLERWGWEYVDPGSPQPSPALFNEPRWAEPAGPDVQGLEARSAYLRSKAVKRGAIIGGVLLLAGIPHAAPFFVLVALVLAAVWFGPLLVSSSQAADRRNRYQAERGRAGAEYWRVHGEWERSVAEWDAAERDRVATANLWFPLGVRSAERVDVFGGTPDGWASLLAVMGASMLRAGSPMLVVDMSENDVAAALSVVARSQDQRVVCQELPRQLDQAQLLRGLSSEEISELIGEALGTLRAGADDVGLRMLDSDLLKGVADRLEPPVTFARLVAGLRVLEGSYDTSSGPGPLSGQEFQRLAGYVDAVGQAERTAGEVRFLRSALELLLDSPAGNGSPGAGELWAKGGLTLLVSQDHNLRRRDLVDRLIAQALLHHLRRARHGNRPGPVAVLVVAGADHLGQRTLEELARQAKNAGVRLVLLIEHLRGDLQQLLGGSDSASLIMRLGNAQEAAAAAEYIGRGHSFTLTQLSRQTGDTRTTGTSTSTGSSTTHSTSNGRSGGRAGMGWNQSESDSESTSTQEGTSESWATSVSDSQTVTRVYEFTVEPTQIQSLPASAFIMVESAVGDRRIIAGSCDPLVVTLDRVADEEYRDGHHQQADHGQHSGAASSSEENIADSSPGQQTGTADPSAAASLFIIDPPGQLQYLAQRLGRAGYVVHRVDIPGDPLKRGWRVTSADGSPVSPDDVMRYR
jgi:hypothetical protein